MGLMTKLFGTYSSRELKRIEPTVNRVLNLEEKYASLSDSELSGMTNVLKGRLSAGETLDDILPDAFAVCREAGWRVLGLKAFPVQVMGGIVLHQGRISEMKTGEGKTLVATLPAYLNALSGNGVHIVTVNDYLAKYAAELMGKVYSFLGLTVGLIVNGLDSDQRRQAYAADITYGTNNELGFDYLRDNMVIYKEQRVQRGHNFCIVDEVDSILIDEARTPLIISGKGDSSSDLYKLADRFAKGLRMVKVKELDSKDDADSIDGDYIVDEKARTATLTEAGVKKAERFFSVDNLSDPDNTNLQHYINQAIKANGVMHRDTDYVVRDGQVIIVDEFTGRLMLGRRYNEGLHQAIEAKENVKVESESKTLATITFQNFFRLYKKLSGMTGTALTEQDEFREIYGLDVIEIPTNKPMIRVDHPDAVYKTAAGKYNAIIEQIVECHSKGQPVLVGTVSIEKSELLSSLLKKRGIKHEVLNAKYHEKEAEIVAQAGQFGAVTIATNMAGRGTDIMLGGNAEFMAKSEMRKMGYDEKAISDASSFFETDDEQILNSREVFKGLIKKYKDIIAPEAKKVCDAGGLFIIGTERHDSRRIDNQLRGRAGRQGDVGESRFYLSLEDDLMRLFGGERLQAMMGSLGIDENTPIEAKLLSNSIESAQRKVEVKNFGIRKNVLEFDNVMNTQREVIYKQRAKVLDGENIKDVILKMIDETIDSAVNSYAHEDDAHDDWNLAGLREYFGGWLCTSDDFRYNTPEELSDASADEIKGTLKTRAHELYDKREEQFGSSVMRELERVILLRNVDSRWMDHIDDMDELKRGIYLRSYAQKNPVVEYRVEGSEMFDAMISAIRENTAKMMLTVQIRQNESSPKREQVLKPTSQSGSGDESIKKEPIKKGEKVGRNDPCPCGSGKKYKKCCGLNE